MVGLGRTGKEIARMIWEQNDMQIVAAVCSPNSSKIGKDLGQIIGCDETGITVESSQHIEQIVFRVRPDVVVDFSNPAATVRNAKIFAKLKVNMVIGTTGFSDMALRKLLVLSRKYRIGILYAPNITLGVNVLMLLTNLAASLLNNYDFRITEMHHKHKKDAPSGTALKISEEIQKGLVSSGIDSSEINVPINAVRAGGIIGKHEVMIIGEDDKIEISHESFSRKAFAQGTIKGIRFVYGKSGYFEMKDVLNLKKALGDYLEEENCRKRKRHLYYYNFGDLEHKETMTQ
jgi:4-hydroxy-tetrahydrodipicolinate reductase